MQKPYTNTKNDIAHLIVILNFQIYKLLTINKNKKILKKIVRKKITNFE